MSSSYYSSEHHYTFSFASERTCSYHSYPMAYFLCPTICACQIDILIHPESSATPKDQDQTSQQAEVSTATGNQRSISLPVVSRTIGCRNGCWLSRWREYLPVRRLCWSPTSHPVSTGQSSSISQVANTKSSDWLDTNPSSSFLFCISQDWLNRSSICLIYWQINFDFVSWLCWFGEWFEVKVVELRWTGMGSFGPI